MHVITATNFPFQNQIQKRQRQHVVIDRRVDGMRERSDRNCVKFGFVFAGAQVRDKCSNLERCSPCCRSGHARQIAAQSRSAHGVGSKTSVVGTRHQKNVGATNSHLHHGKTYRTSRHCFDICHPSSPHTIHPQCQEEFQWLSSCFEASVRSRRALQCDPPQISDQSASRAHLSVVSFSTYASAFCATVFSVCHLLDNTISLTTFPTHPVTTTAVESLSTATFLVARLSTAFLLQQQLSVVWQLWFATYLFIVQLSSHLMFHNHTSYTCCHDHARKKKRTTNLFPTPTFFNHPTA